MQNIDIVTMGELSREVKAKLEKMGIILVDESLYTNDRMIMNSTITVLTGYLTWRAVVFGVNIGSWRGMKFTITITGQLKEGWKKEIGHDPSNIFPKVKRKCSEKEIAVGREFTINNYVDDRIEKDEQIKRGMAFFQEFILEYGCFLEDKFIKRMRLSVVPVNSDQFVKMSRKEGVEKTLNYFERIIISKFPEGFFPVQETEPASACG